MNRHILFIALMAGLLSTTCQKAASGDVSADEQNSDVSLTITKFQVNDQTLELSYKIKNDSGHDVWICDRIDDSDSRFSFEAYLAEDAETLIIRKRLDVHPEVIWSAIPEGRYLRLQPGQEKTESLSLDLPVYPQLVYISKRANAEHARRLVLEIGYYNKDLPGLIRSIIEVTERLGCASPDLNEDYNSDIFRCYFPGLLIPLQFGTLSYFDETYNDVSEQFLTAYTDELLGEQVLQATVEGVDVPYTGTSAANEPTQTETEPGGVIMALTGFDVNDTKLELSWKIKNNTDHDVWICDDVYVWSTMDFEVYLSEDEQTLMIRKRLDVPTNVVWCILPYGRYVLLRSDQERTESVSLDVPVGPCRLYADGLALPYSDHAGRLVLEIGFYDEDLPKLIRDILEMAEEVDCGHLEYNSKYTLAFFARYFKGAWIAQLFGGLSGFEENAYKEGSEEIRIPYSTYSRENFGVEQVLRIEVDGVHIPYDENAPIITEGTSPLPPKGKACFPAETPVWVDGMLVPISKVVAGQAVGRSLCETPGPWSNQVEEVQEHTGTFECRDIILENGNRIGVVGAHCFMLSNGDWIAAQDLKSGLSLRTLHGTVRIRSVTVRAAPYTGKVYNLKIENSGQYLVGRDALIVRDY
jgi:hypothetical protein